MTQMPPADFAWTPAPPPLPKPKWPTVIGIISICLAGLGLLGSAWNLAQGGGKVRQYGANGEIEYRRIVDVLPPSLGNLQMVNQVAGMVLAATLLVGGIMLVRRVPAARLLHLVYAALTILTCVVGLMLVGPIIEAMRPGMFPQGRSAPSPAVADMAVSMARVIASAIVLLGMVYPVFLLIWLSRRKVREHVRSWR